MRHSFVSVLRAGRKHGVSLRSAVFVAGVLGLLLAAGCVADTMRGFVGQNVSAVMLTYGPPAGQFDLGDGRRAFQWSRTSIDTTPETAVETTTRDKKGRRTTTTQYTGGNQAVSRCLYTFITVWDATRQSWMVTGFQPPSFDCAIGDLG